MKIRLKMLLCCALCVLVCATAISFFSNRTYYREITQDRADEYQLTIRQMLNNVSLTTKDAEASFISLYNSTDLIASITDHESPQATRERNLQSKLRYMCYNSTYFSAVAFMDESGNLRAETSSAVANCDALSALVQSKSDRLRSNYTSWFADDNGGVYLKKDIYAVTPLYYCGMLVAELNADYLREILGLDMASERTGQLFIFSPEGELLMTNMPQHCPEIHEIYDGWLANKRAYEGNIRYQDKDYYLQMESADHSWKILHMVPVSQMEALSRRIFSTNMLIGAVIFLLLVPLIWLFTYPLTRGIKQLYRSMNVVSKGDFTVELIPCARDEVGELTTHFNWLVRQLNEFTDLSVRQAVAREQAEYAMMEISYRSLLSRISPHFICNILSTINAQAALGQTDKVGDLSILASRYLRRNLNRTDDTYTTLSEEIDYLEDYLEIFRCIYGDSVILEINVPEETLPARVPCMMLQPLFENTLIHGGLDLTAEKYRLSLSASVENGEVLHLRLQDNGNGIPSDILDQLRQDLCPEVEVTKGKGFGLRGTVKRLYLLYKENQSFDIQSSDKGTEIMIVIPFISGTTDDTLPDDPVQSP